MSYRSLTRLLGETRLEWKCRWLFAGSLLLLISCSFLLVDSIAENLVMKNTRSKSRDLVDILMMKLHFERWQTEPKFKPFAEALVEDFDIDKNYRYEILTLADESHLTDINAKKAANAEEEEILRILQRKLEQRESEFAAAEAEVEANSAKLQTNENNPSDTDSGPAGKLVTDLLAPAPISEARALPQIDEYHYYEPISWKTTCKSCHFTLQELGVVPSSDPAGLVTDSSSLHAIKVITPFRETQAAINKVRAVLVTVAIITVFLAMVALYAVVRYVIVRPLKHLRDVSDAISHGNTKLRAEIQTHDEFEELAASFNRMMHTMTDAQDKLRDVNRDLDGKVDELAQLNVRLHEMNRLKSEFLANMSHELRTPLNSIIGFSEVLQSIDSLDEKQKRYAENIQKSGRLLLEMINDILDLAKMEAGKMDLRPTEFSGDAVLGAQCDMVRSLTEEKNIDLEVNVAGCHEPLVQDQTKLQQILTNLLSNAIKYTPEGGRITVTARKDHLGRFELTVKDTGVGIAEEDHEVIFEKFRQSTSDPKQDNLTREFSGTGLGLSIVKELCKLMGGEISFESELGKGSTFKVVLPWTLADAASQQSNSQLDQLSKPQDLRFASNWQSRPAASPTAFTGPQTER